MDTRQAINPLNSTELLVGILDSQWSLTAPHALLPGDIILRVGSSESTSSTYAPFKDGLYSVKREILGWCLRDQRKQNRVLLQVLRGNSRLEIWSRVTPSAAAEAASHEAVFSDGSYDATASFGTASCRLAGTFETDGSYDAGENLLEGVVLSEGRHALFAPLAAWTEESILRLERIKAYGALANHKPRPVEKAEQRNRRGEQTSRLPPASAASTARTRRLAGIGWCFAGGAVEGEGAMGEEVEDADERGDLGKAEEEQRHADGSLPAREAAGKLAEGITRLRVGWGRARDGAEGAGERAPLLAHAAHPAGMELGGRIGEADGDCGGSGRKDAEGGLQQEAELDRDRDGGGEMGSERDTTAARAMRFEGSRAVSGEPQVLLPHLYCRTAATGEGVFRVAAAASVAEEAAGPDMESRTRPSSPYPLHLNPAVATDTAATDAAAADSAATDSAATDSAATDSAAADAAAAGAAAAAGMAPPGRLWTGRAGLVGEGRLWNGGLLGGGPVGGGPGVLMEGGFDGTLGVKLAIASAAPSAAPSACMPSSACVTDATGFSQASNLPVPWLGTHALPTPCPVLKVRRHCIAEAPERDDSGGGSKALGGGGPASLFTILVMPAESGGKKENRRFFDVNHTIDRALRWFSAVRASGAALELMNAQTEVLPVRLGGMDGDKLAKMAQYGKWTVKTTDPTRGDHVSVLRAVRLWLVPESEVELTLVLNSGVIYTNNENSPVNGGNYAACPPDWGLLLEQTPEGVVHVVGVRGGSPADKGGVGMLLRMAEAKKRLLVLSRLQGQVLVPAVIANGQIDCADVEALQEQLVLQAHLPSIPLRLTLAL